MFEKKRVTVAMVIALLSTSITCKDADFTEKEMYQDLVLYGV